MYMVSGFWCRAMEWIHGLESEWDTSLYIGKMSVDVCLWGWVVLSFILVLLLLCFVPKPFSRLLDKISAYLFPLAILVWLVGIFVYAIGFYNPSLTGWAVLPRAILASFRMFLVNNELARVSKSLQESNHYMICFAWTHFFAATLSFLFVIRLIGFRFWAWVNLFVKSRFTHKSVYVFWGINDASLLLAESIRKQEKNANHNLIAFVNTTDISDKTPNAQIGMMKIVDLMNFRNKDEDRMLGIDNVLITNCHRELSAVVGNSIDDAFRNLHLMSLRRILKRANEVHFFLLSDDEEKNILSAVKLCNLFKKEHHTKEIEIFAHARQSLKNEMYNDYSLYAAGRNEDSKTEEKGCEPKIKLIDSSKLAIDYLKYNFKYHPIHLVDIDASTATVTSPFNALLVGFGEVGRDAFRFLYEFGAFVGKDGNRSPFLCHAIDADMHQIEGSYAASTTDIVGKELVLIDAKIGSEIYQNTLNEIIGMLNCVVVAINNDDLALATAVRIYRQAMQCCKNDLKKFRIFVHCREQEHLNRMKEVAATLNKCNNTEDGIVVFGDKKELYTYDLIVDNKLIHEAKRYHKCYAVAAASILSEDKIAEIEVQELNGRDKTKMNSQELEEFEQAVRLKIQEEGTKLRQDAMSKDEEKHWSEAFNVDACHKEVKKTGCTYLAGLQEVNRKREQNISNSRHKETKAMLLGIATHDTEKLEQWDQQLKPRREQGDYDYSKTSLSEAEQKQLANVARCEHIRWEASHQLMGYKQGEAKSTVLKTHPDMLSWDKLSAYTKAFDYNVVDTSIELLLEDAKRCQSNLKGCC